MNLNRRFLSLMLITMLAATLGVTPSAAQDSITLVVWDIWSRDVDSAVIDQLNEEFMEAHPGVTIQREVYDLFDLMAIQPLAFSEAGGPDVSMINQGYVGTGTLVEAGLLLPLNDYADQYGWWDRYAMGLHARNSFSADGKQFGVGNLYSIANLAEIVGVFYHRDIFEEFGFEIPQTLAEFEAILAALKEADITPIAFGSLDGWPAIHEYGAIQHAYATLEELDLFMYRLEGGTFDTEANLKAAEKLVEWVNAGYFSPGFAGMDYDIQTFNAFVNKEGAMWITGSWMAGPIVDALGQEPVGFFLFPPENADDPPLNIGGVNVGYGIPANSRNPDLAAEYIDFVTGPRATELLFELGHLPAGPVDPDLLTEGTLTADLVNAWDTASSQNAVGHYLDWTVPNIDSNIQELMGGVVTPEQFIADVEEDFLAGR